MNLKGKKLNEISFCELIIANAVDNVVIIKCITADNSDMDDLAMRF